MPVWRSDLSFTVDVVAEDPLLKVGEVAKQTNRSIRALRLYEEHGLLEPAARSEGGFRLYGRDAIGRIEWIERLQGMGFSLAEVEQILEVTRSDAPAPRSMRAIRDLFAARLDDTRTQVETLLRLERDLSDTITYLLECRTCRESTPARDACPTCEVRHPERHDRPAPPLVTGMQPTQRSK